MIRVFILIGYFLFLSISCVFSQETQNYKNDLRTLFLNNQAIIYEINLRTFNANDANNNDIIDFDNENERKGTFLNAISRLDELTQFNINTLHILPITKIGKIKTKEWQNQKLIPTAENKDAEELGITIAIKEPITFTK